MKRRTSILALLLFGITLCFWLSVMARNKAQRPLNVVRALFPGSSEVKGWTRKGAPRFFKGDGIFHYMDGAGEIPKACGFRILGVADYAGIDGVTVTAEIYDMGNSANAFGLYSLKRDPTEIFRELDHRAMLGAGELIFWKGCYTVLLFSDIQKKMKDDELLSLGRAISARIKQKGALPDLLAYLPTESYIENSVKYFHGKFALDTIQFIKNNAFRLGPHTDVAVAAYEGPKRRLMLIRYPSMGAAERAMRTYHESFEVKSMMATQHGPFIGVVWGGKDEFAAKQLLTRLSHTLKEPSSPWDEG